jgi:DNA/RNA endonuclease YhcR with UshA esterase domain
MKIMRGLGLSLLVASGATSLPVQAHHSFPATYFVDQKVEIEGTVVQFLFRNPHSFVHVMAPDKDGVMQRWAVEWGAGGSLASDNISSDTLKPGDKVKIAGSPARNAADHRLRMKSIERTNDHWKWSGTFG